MPRKIGHDGRVAKALEETENARFGLKRADMDLEIAELKVKQAMRDPRPELLKSVIELIREARQRIQANT